MAHLIQANETREKLRLIYARDPEASLLHQVIRRLADPVKPLNEKGRFRPHPMLAWLTVIGLLAVGIFVYFGCNQP